MITQEELKEVLHYDPETGLFTWIKRTSNRIKIGDVAGRYDRFNYNEIAVFGKNRKAHRLAWLYTYGSMPSKHIDHIDGNPSNNKIVNLREATSSQNQYNAKKRKDNTSGYRGVSWHSMTQKWKASIQIDKKPKYIGVYSTKKEAYRAYKIQAHKHFGEFARFE